MNGGAHQSKGKETPGKLNHRETRSLMPSFPDYANTANGPNHIEYLSYGRNWAVSKWAYPGAVTNASVVNKIVDFNWPNQIAYVKGQFNSDLNNGACGANSLFLMSASNTANDIFQSWNQTAANTPDARKATIGAMINTLGTGLNDVSDP